MGGTQIKDKDTNDVTEPFPCMYSLCKDCHNFQKSMSTEKWENVDVSSTDEFDANVRYRFKVKSDTETTPWVHIVNSISGWMSDWDPTEPSPFIYINPEYYKYSNHNYN